MEAHQLSRVEVADMLIVTGHTVRSWLRPGAQGGSTRMPERSLEMLKMRLGIAK